MNKYIILYEKAYGVTNEEFYSDFYGYEFTAENDKDAINKVKAFQTQCERAQEAAGVKLCAYDPAFMPGLYRYDPAEDEYNPVIQRGG